MCFGVLGGGEGGGSINGEGGINIEVSPNKGYIYGDPHSKDYKLGSPYFGRVPSFTKGFILADMWGAQVHPSHESSSS